MSSADADPPQPPSLQELRELAESATRVGGSLARESFGQLQAVALKADRSEVTEIDVAAEQAIIAHLCSRRPDDLFVAEEATERPFDRAQGRLRDEATKKKQRRNEERESQRDKRTKTRRHDGNAAASIPPAREANCQSPIPNRQSSIASPQSIWWIIDPLDGTRNYVRGVPLFACSVAAMCEGVPVAGAVYDPIGEVMYAADATTGAHVNGRPLSSRAAEAFRPPPGADKLVVAIPSARHRRGRALVRAVLERHVVRNLGCTTLHLALVAAGRFDAAVTNNSKLWDIAAGWLLVSQAGGVITGHGGDELFPVDVARYKGGEIPVLAGTRAAHARLLRESARG